MKLAARIARVSLAFVVGTLFAFIVPFAYALLAWESDDWFQRAGMGREADWDGKDEP